MKQKKEYEIHEATPEQIQGMQLAEHEIEKRQLVEYQDKIQREPDTQIALDKLLLGVEVRSSEIKEMIPNIIKMPDGTLRPKATKIKRATFHSITKSEVLNALQNPRKIDQALVDAQQARRLLDRIVGYKISPILSKVITVVSQPRMHPKAGVFSRSICRSINSL